MSFQTAVSSKCLPTVFTPVRSDSTVYQKMSFQMAVFSKRLPTVVTRVRLIASAPPTVNYDVAPCRRRLSIALTFFMVFWTSVDMFFLALPPGVVVGTAFLQLHETCKRG